LRDRPRRYLLVSVGTIFRTDSYVVPVGVEDEEAMNRADVLAATAADVLADDFADFLFPDAPGAGDPQA
jgi:hypothetical protein